MKVSVIVAVYKDIVALNLIIQMLKLQTYKDFEVVIVEDNNSQKMKTYIESIKGLEIKHTSQEDTGIRKMRSLNNGIVASSGEYLIFIDGDCVPYTTFVESYVLLAEEGYISSGRRVNLGKKYSKMLRDKELSPVELEKSFLLNFFAMNKDSEERHIEEGFYVNPTGWLYNTFLKNRNATVDILGCNYACFKKDMVAINGYDEFYDGTAVGDDTDMQWRFQAIGLKIKSARNLANIFHLYHPRTLRENVDWKDKYDIMLENKKNNNYICVEGITTHQKDLD
jgi:glycosyltransferase involved in cell wall biosynthesis